MKPNTRPSGRAAALLAMLSVVLPVATAIAAQPAPGPYAAWERGPGKGDDFFPIAVWLQTPSNAERYKAIGVNLYVGLWQGPTAEQLAELRKQQMLLICSQNRYALEHLDEPLIVGWMHDDEPDNAQSLGEGRGYGPPILPERIIENYQKIKANDPTRPVMLNLGQGVAWDGWYGRGVRTNHPEDYLQYVRGTDIVSFDIYPATHDRPEIAGKLWYVAQGADRLRQWTDGKKPTWTCIECTRISNVKLKPTPHQVKAEVWMALVHGSRGLIYFCHQFQPQFIEAGLLADDQMSQAVGRINRQIHELAAVLNSPTISNALTVTTEPAAISPDPARLLKMAPVATMIKRHNSDIYLFAVRMESSPVKATFQLAGLPATATVEVLGENRELKAVYGRFDDSFMADEVHLYRIH
jgi:hypothetical protein